MPSNYAEIFLKPCPCAKCGRADGCSDKDGLVVFCTEMVGR